MLLRTLGVDSLVLEANPQMLKSNKFVQLLLI